MYDISLKNLKKGRLLPIIFILGGIVFSIIVSFFPYLIVHNNNEYDESTMSTKVEVTPYRDNEGNKRYSQIFYYEVDGKEYSCNSGISRNYAPSTKNKKVYYDSTWPSSCLTTPEKSISYIFLIFILIPIRGIYVGVRDLKKVNKKIKEVIDLNQYGKLVKNLPYKLEDARVFINNVQLKRIVVDYTLPDGSRTTLYGEPRYDKKYIDDDMMVDLIIDENDPSKYFIDLEINRLTGNLESDYYNPNN